MTYSSFSGEEFQYTFFCVLINVEIRLFEYTDKNVRINIKIQVVSRSSDPVLWKFLFRLH